MTLYYNNPIKINIEINHLIETFYSLYTDDKTINIQDTLFKIKEISKMKIGGVAKKR